MKRRYVAVAGTHGWDGGEPTADDWWCPTSPFAQFLANNGHLPLELTRPFIWSTALAGVPTWQFWKRPKPTHWEAAAWALIYYADNAPINVISHSHGLQVVMMAAKFWLKIGTLIDVCGPVRGDMMDTYRAGLLNIGTWVHVHSDGSDLIQLAGAWFDGHLGPVRAVAIEGVVNVPLPGVGHTRLLNDPTLFDVWKAQGWVTRLDWA
jgi:hypothetical protein